MANSWTFRQRVSITNDHKLQKIIQFYLIESPVEGLSQKGKSFADYGWKGGSFNTLHKLMREIGFTNDSWKCVSLKDVENELRKIERWDKYDCSFEFVVHSNRELKGNDGKTQSLFAFIRNAFAHGSFRKHEFNNEKYYALENNHNNKVKGRAVVRESTLLVLKRIVKSNGK